MPLTENLVSTMRGLFGSNGTDYSLLLDRAERDLPEDRTGRYDMLEALYYNDRASHIEGSESLVIGLRNPTPGVVNFYSATVMPGTLPEALPIVMDATSEADKRRVQATIAAIHQVWEWSNWNVNKQWFVRQTGMLGDSLIKVATRTNRNDDVDRVFYRLIDPRHLTDFDVDERGFMTYCRLDVPRQRRNGGDIERYTHTEVWDKDPGLYRVWEHDGGAQSDLSELGRPVREQTQESMGIDFLPFVHSKFMDLGHKRGVAAITPALVKAHEANRMSSRLHQVMFQYGRPDMVLYSDLTDDDGQPMPAPIIEDSGGKVDVGDGTLHRLPSGWKLDHLIANLPFMAHLEVLNAHMEHMQQTDLPELAYYRIADSRELSGKAIRFMLTAAIAKAEEVRGNLEASLIRANQMALTMGAYHRLPGFTDIGNYQTAYRDGLFKHTFRERSVVPLSEEEDADINKVKAETNEKRLKYGWTMRALLKEDGVPDDDIDDMLAELPSDALAGQVLDQPGNQQANDLLNAALARGE